MSPMGSEDRDPQSWRGSDIHEDLRTGGETRSVLERAHRTRIPYQYEDEEHLKDEEVFEEFQTREYTRARVRYDAGVQDNGRIKLFTQGHFWGGEDDHQRFKAQYRRPPPPTETVPFDTYEVWMRYQFGSVERDAANKIVFEPNEDRTGEELRDLPWEELFTPVKHRLAELELIRNPPLARYVLLDIGEWEEYEIRFRYDTTAFSVGP